MALGAGWPRKAQANASMNIAGSRDYIKRRKDKLGDNDYETEDMEAAVNESSDMQKCSCGRRKLGGHCPSCSDKAKATREKRKAEKAAAAGMGSIAGDIFDRTADTAVE